MGVLSEWVYHTPLSDGEAPSVDWAEGTVEVDVSDNFDRRMWVSAFDNPRWVEGKCYRFKQAVDESPTGGSSDYYKADIQHPTTASKAYTAECNDIIEALGLDFTEGNIFKAIWRNAKARLGQGKSGNSEQYDIEKVFFFAVRLLVQCWAKSGKVDADGLREIQKATGAIWAAKKGEK